MFTAAWKPWKAAAGPRRAVLALAIALSCQARAAEKHSEAAPNPVLSVQWRQPLALVCSPDAGKLYVACAGTAEVIALDLERGQAEQNFPLPAGPSGMVLHPDGTRLYVTCASPESSLCEIDRVQGTTRTWQGRHTAMSPVLSASGDTLFVCNRFSASVSAYGLPSRTERFTVPVAREPIAAALSQDGRYLLVAHHLPEADQQAAGVTVLDVDRAAVVKVLALPLGSTLLREIRVSPDGAYAAVVHNLARFQAPTTQLDRGWMNTSALTLIQLDELRVLNSVLLDEVDRGAANPWSLDWSTDGRWLCLSHAGTHEVSVIDFPALCAKLRGSQNARKSARTPDEPALVPAENVPDDLGYLVKIRRRIKLQGNGPRSVRIAGNYAFVAGYFSGTVEKVDLSASKLTGAPVFLNGSSGLPAPLVGERLFNDAEICFQGWQSCATCHSDDARIDGLNWDLLNDGLGNPKNGRSLLYSHRTPPAMSTGVRDTAETAVRAGIQHILFSAQPETVPLAIDTWLKALAPVRSPHLVQGKLSASARRGEQLFANPALRCSHCHKPGLWSDLKQYDVGTAGPLDREVKEFDTPALIELWRTAPYLHDGSAATVREVLTTRNPGDRHGHTSQLSPDQLDDLIEFLLSL